MESAWKIRLKKALEDDGRKMSVISKAAGLGVNYVSQFINTDTTPSVEAFMAITRELKVSPVYILLGFEMTATTEDLVARFEGMEEDRRDALLKALDLEKVSSRRQEVSSGSRVGE